MYVNQAAIDEARDHLGSMSMLLVDDTERALVECILRHWVDVADKVDEALVNHFWPEATIVIRCKDVHERLALFLAFTRPSRSSEWHLNPAKVRIAYRGGFLYKWDLIIENGKAVLVHNKRKVVPVATP